MKYGWEMQSSNPTPTPLKKLPEKEKNRIRAAKW